MLQGVNPVVLLGLIAASVLLFTLSAGAAPIESTTSAEGVASPGDGVSENDVAPGEDVVLDEVYASEAGGVPDRGTGPDESIKTEDTFSRVRAQEGNVTLEPDTATEGEAQDVQVEVPEETVEAFEEMLHAAEAADGEYKNALFEEGRLNHEIAQTRSDLATAENNLEEAQNNLEDQATRMYKYGKDGFMSVLLGADNFREFANLLGSWVQILEDDQAKVRQWRESKRELEQTAEDLETQLQSWEQTREEEATQKEQARDRLKETQDIFESLDEEAQKEIEKEQVNESALALDHAQKMIWEASQEEPAEETGNSDENAGNERASRTEAEGSDEPTMEEEKVRQAQVAQAVADTILEWPTIKEQLKDVSVHYASKQDEAAGEAPNQNPAAEQLAAAAENKAAAQEEARKAAEQAAREREAANEAARLIDEAENARQATEKAPIADRAKLQTAAEEAALQANFATEQANEEKQAAADTATQAAYKLNAADKELTDAQKAAGKATPFALDPTAPALDSTGQPISPGSGGGVLDEAKSWLGVPYDYTHNKGQTRAGVDCSAFTAAVYSKFGVVLPDSPIGQLGKGTPVSGSPKAGDLVFFSEDGSGVPTHVGIANGDGTLTHASSFTGKVSVTPMKYIKGYMGARRLL